MSDQRLYDRLGGKGAIDAAGLMYLGATMPIEQTIQSLADKYASTLENVTDARVEDMPQNAQDDVHPGIMSRALLRSI